MGQCSGSGIFICFADTNAGSGPSNNLKTTKLGLKFMSGDSKSYPTDNSQTFPSAQVVLDFCQKSDCGCSLRVFIPITH